LLLPATPLVHRHARILRTIPVDHTTSFVHVPDLHHRLLADTDHLLICLEQLRTEKILLW
jgi:hypothetical protein